MVRVWMADITPLLMEEIYQKYYQQAPVWRQEKADRYRRPEDRAQSIGVWSLWEKVRVSLGLPETTVYNLSHSGRYALCACSDRECVQVGCDLEEIKKFREPVARRFFCSGEYEHIMSKEEPDRTQLFYRYWVLKESYMKATRRGMALDMHRYEIGWTKEEQPVLLTQPEEFPDKYYYQEYEKRGANVRIAVCTTDPEIDGKLKEFAL